MIRIFDIIVVISENDFGRIKSNLKCLADNLPGRKIIIISNANVGKEISENIQNARISFVNEEDVIPFEAVAKAMRERMSVSSLPRGIVGWYYQQFLKIEYSRLCEEDYYLSWDGDTVPCKKFDMFDVYGNPYFDMKYEYNEEYFITLKSLLGIEKQVRKSFVAEHMLFSTKLMREMIADIEGNSKLKGTRFFEKVFNAIRDGKVDDTSFSEFETYGNYVLSKYPEKYAMKDWHSIRYGAKYFIPEKMQAEDYRWLSKDFDAISFEKNMEYEPDFAALFSNKEYRSKLTPRKMIEIIQESSEGGLYEVWEDADSNKEAAEFVIGDEKDISNKDEYLFFNYLGDNLIKTNPNQAYLCYENASFLCNDSSISNAILEKSKVLFNTGKVNVKKASFVILSYNSKYLMQECLASIKKYCSPTSYSVVVVDNASTDGIDKWLEKQNFIKLVKNKENLGFPAGCNIGIEASNPDEDIFLLNNDTRMTHNSLFWLRMGLYENVNIGATGAVSNYTSLEQRMDIKFDTPTEYVDFGIKNNVFMTNPYEEKSKLSGFAMLIRREAIDDVGGLDPLFYPGFYEDDDLCIRLRQFGYRLMICHNSFIYHVGSQSFRKREDIDEVLLNSHKKLFDKWGIKSSTYSIISNAEEKAFKQIEADSGSNLRILEVGSGCGNMLTRMKHRFPYAEIVGIEAMKLAVELGVEDSANMYANWKTDRIPFVEGYFDYIIWNRREDEKQDDELFHEIMNRYLFRDGRIIVVDS